MDDFITQHLAGVSRTYAIVVPMLPAPLDDTVGPAYLLMRIVDTLEDAPQLDSAERRRRLGDLDAALGGNAAAAQRLAAPLGDRPVGDLPAEHALMRAAPEVFRRLAALPPPCRAPLVVCARAMRAGVLTLADRAATRGLPYPAIRTAAELREYCYYVAGVVGEMLCTLMADHLTRAEPLPSAARQAAAERILGLRDIAVELGIGLQLVNILKDAGTDARHGRRYLPPKARCPSSRSAGPPPPGSAGPPWPAWEGEDVYAATLAAAQTSLRRGVDYVLALPAALPGLRAFCGLPIAWGALTLARAAGDPAAAKIDRAAIRQSITDFASRAGNDEALHSWLLSLLHAAAS